MTLASASNAKPSTVCVTSTVYERYKMGRTVTVTVHTIHDHPFFIAATRSVGM
jgi:hypothetical protein